MSDSNAVQFAYVAEATYMTNPNAAMRALPRVSGGLQPAHETMRSKQVRSDRQLASTRRTDKMGRAQIDFELSAKNYDPFMAAAILSGAWSTAVNFSGTLSSVASTKKFTGTGVHTNAYVGQWVYVDGLDAAVNGWHRITAVGTNEITVASTLADKTGGGDETVKGAYILNGTTQNSFVLQEYFTDLTTTEYQYSLGNVVEKMSLRLAKGDLITGQIGWQGGPVVMAEAAQGNGTVGDAYDEDPGSEVESFSGIYVDDALLTVDVTDFSMDFSVPLRMRRGLGGDEPTSMGYGALAATGGMSLYRENDTGAYLAKYLAFTSMRIAVSLDMGNGDLYLIEWPRAVFTSPPSQTPGLDQDVMLDFEWAAEPGGAFGSTSLERTVIINRVQGS